MQKLGDDSWVISASDLSVYAQCPWRLARVADEKLGKSVTVPKIDDPMMVLVARLGLEHEDRQLQLLKKNVGTVVEIDYQRGDSSDVALWRASITAAAEATRGALGSDAGAIFQGVFYQQQLPGTDLKVGFQGFADFLVKANQSWEVWDTKLARRAKDTALVQLAAYVDQLHLLSIATSESVHLVLGDGTHSIHLATDHLQDYFTMREQVVALIEERSLDIDPLPWRDERYAACGTKGCPACSEQVAIHDDLFLIAGIKRTQRDKIMVAGFSTLRDFAQARRDEVRRHVTGISRDTLFGLHLQATLQLETRDNPENRPAWEVTSSSILHNIPAPSPGDVFFDFEGDPTYQEGETAGGGPDGAPEDDEPVWFGIEYLFGLWGEGIGAPEVDPHFLPLWAESFEEEKRSLEYFCALMTARLEKFPDMHIYHYASYEKTRLTVMAKRHDTALTCVERLKDGVLVDLYSTVMKGLKVGLPSYSLKALEALYFEPNTRSGIAGGGESVVAFSDYSQAVASDDQATAQRIKSSILNYNRIDCFSTQALRDWLLEAAKNPRV